MKVANNVHIAHQLGPELSPTSPTELQQCSRRAAGSLFYGDQSVPLDIPCFADGPQVVSAVAPKLHLERGHHHLDFEREAQRDYVTIDSLTSYHEWATQRRPGKRPPGLPRPPRRVEFQAPQAVCATQAYCCVDDDDLDGEWEAWYARNVATGVFTDWLSEQTRADSPALPESDQSAFGHDHATPGTPAVVNPDIQPSSGTGDIMGHSTASTINGSDNSFGCTLQSSSGETARQADDVDPHSDEWFARNVANGMFASWMEGGRAAAAPEAEAYPSAGLAVAAGAGVPQICAPAPDLTTAEAAPNCVPAPADGSTAIGSAAIRTVPSASAEPSRFVAAGCSAGVDSASEPASSGAAAAPGALQFLRSPSARRHGPYRLPLCLEAICGSTRLLDEACETAASGPASLSWAPPSSAAAGAVRAIVGLTADGDAGSAFVLRMLHTTVCASVSEDGDESTPCSPMAFDGRTLPEEESSRDSSRSCSALSLQSWGEACGSGSSNWDEEEDSEETAGGNAVTEEAGEGSVGRTGDGSCWEAGHCAGTGDAAARIGCASASVQGCFWRGRRGGYQMGVLDEGASRTGDLVEEVDCAVWEVEVEGRAASPGTASTTAVMAAVAGIVSDALGHSRFLPEEGKEEGEADLSLVESGAQTGMWDKIDGGCRHGVVGYATLPWGGVGEAEDDDGLTCPAWLEPQLAGMLAAVVTDALFAADGPCPDSGY